MFIPVRDSTAPLPLLTPLKTHQKDININFPSAREITIVTALSRINLPSTIYRFSHASWIYHAIPVKRGEFKITPPPPYDRSMEGGNRERQGKEKEKRWKFPKFEGRGELELEKNEAVE